MNDTIISLDFSRERAYYASNMSERPRGVRIGIIQAMSEDAASRRAEEESIARGEQPRDPVFTSGMFIQGSGLPFFKQAADNLGGITVEVLEETPAKQRLPRWYKFKEDEAKVRVTREDGVRDLRAFLGRG